METKLVNWNLVFPGMGLKDSSQESLREVKSAYPIAIRIAVQKPIGHKRNSLIQIFYPTCQRLQRWVGHCFPRFRNLVIYKAEIH